MIDPPRPIIGSIFCTRKSGASPRMLGGSLASSCAKADFNEAEARASDAVIKVVGSGLIFGDKTVPSRPG